jgi:hypothetical protein
MVRERLARTFSRTALLAGVAAVVALAWWLWMTFAFTAWPAPYWFEHRFVRTVDSPVLALEFARSERERNAVFQRENDVNPDPQKSAEAIRALRFHTVLDCIFIPLCCGYLLLLGFSYTPRGRSRTALAATVLALAVVAWSEDVLLLFTAGLVFVLAICKWVLLALTLIQIAGLLGRSSNRGPYSTATRRLLAVVHVAAAGLLIAGLCFSQLPWLALGGRIVAITLCVSAIGLLGPAFAIEGECRETNPDFCQERHKAS